MWNSGSKSRSSSLKKNGPLHVEANKPIVQAVLLRLCQALALIVAMLITPLAWAQTTATLSGTVQDSSGAIVPGAQVKLTNEKAGDTRSVASNGSGFFTFANVLPGSYQVSVKANNFKTYIQPGVALNGGDTRVLPVIALQVGTVSDTVTVESVAGEVLPQDSGERSSVLTTKDIESLVIQGRNVSELLKTLPGVSGLGSTSNAAPGTSLGNGLSPNGTPYRGGSAYLLDGANIIDVGCNCNSIAAADPDMTQEVEIQTSNFGADVPNGPVVISAISKSGGAQYHGSAYFYARNAILNSNTYAYNQNGKPRANNYYYYPGGNIGGPVKLPWTNFNHNDKLLFWGGLELVKQDTASAALTSYVPTAAMLAGNFSAGDPASAALCPGGFTATATTFCNNLANSVAPDGTRITGSSIPSQYLDPGALALAKLFPAANTTPTAANGYTNYFLPTDAPTSGYTYRARIDYNLSDNNKIFVSFQRSASESNTFAKQYTTPAMAVEYPGGILKGSTHPNILTGNFLHVFNNYLTNNFLTALSWYVQTTTPTNSSKLDTSAIGYPYGEVYNGISALAPAFNSPGPSTFPDISQADVFQNGGSYVLKKAFTTFSDDLTYVYRTHTFKLGVYTDRAVNSQGAAQAVNGSLSFAGGLRTDQVTGLKIGSNNPLADFLMGISSGYTQVNQNPSQALSYRINAFYGMDTWKVSSKLTAILSLRFEHIGDWTPHGNNGLAVWEPGRYAEDVAAGKVHPGVYWHGIDSSVPVTGTNTPALLVSPRFSLAYNVHGDGRTVVRGGWGVYRWNDQYNDLAAQLSTAQQVKTYNSVNGDDITLSEISAIGKSGASVGGLPSSVTAIDPSDNKFAATYAYNLTISQQLPWRSLLEIAYVGNQTHNLLLGGESGGGAAIATNYINVNKIPLGGLFKTDPVTGAPAPTNPESLTNLVDYYPLYKGYGTSTVTVPEHLGYSNYNGIQLSWSKQANRFTYNLNYTFSKSLGIANNVDGFTIRENYGVLSIDRKDVINTSYAYRFGNVYTGEHRIIQGIMNGWTLSGITTLQSGGNLQALYSQNLGLTITTATGNQPVTSNTYYGTPFRAIQPLATCAPNKNLLRGQRANLSCLAPPAIGQLGWRQLPYLSAPVYFDSDLGLYKSFKIGERQSIQFRAEAFNFINHPLNAFASTNDIQLKYTTASTVAGTSAFTPNVSVPVNRWGFTDTKNGSRTVELAAKYFF